ncbi:MAG: hypothetical protein PHH59_10955 [Methylovulum sp.]|uniref:hypothetical protein n=1 Tax=Methylovulum sp. TaxID=1916980 RepID=UPI002622331A|nr:hypothetical protein [Methylovulum sp.]MDD2724524.1 hypothetical protein [Methylovulum sp.]MDD5124045.1 hypothetical protein [Methylovulum sp.]
MKNNILLGFAFAVTALNPVLAPAATDAKYPAANFEPTVIYLDKDIVPTAVADAGPEFDAKYPAANFQPKVIYADKDLIEAAEDKFDPKYPAAYFKPKVIYP